MESEGDAVFWWQGRQTAVTRDHNGLLLEQLPHDSCLPCCTGRPSAAVKYVPYAEILCCRYLPIRRYCSGLSPCQRKQRHYMELQVLSRHPARPWLWSIRRLELAAEQPDLVKSWVRSTRQQLRGLSYRPQRLLVFVNPYGGKRQARRTWSKLAEPILTAAGVACDLVETQHQGHAEELVRGLSLEQLQELDGIVAVGGDGLFAELLTAVVQHKHLAAALQLRLGHIPAGSTDAVACTLHGTRDAVTAALHIALGDCTALDVGRMVTLPPSDAQQQPAAAAAAAGTAQQATAAQGQTCSAGQGAAEWHQAGAAPSPVHAAGVWDAGLSVGSHSELLLGRGEVASSSSCAEPTAHEAAAAAAGEAQAGRSVQQSRKQRQQQRRLQKEQRKRSRQQPPAQAQQQQHVSLHVPLLRHFVCVANYGFLGDVMETSERLRWCGPVRYDIAGALRFLLLRQYKATVWYKPAPMHASDTTSEPAAPTPEQQGSKKQRAKQQRLAASDAVVSPAAVLPLPHHRWPALHARLAIPGLRLPWLQQQQQQQQQDTDHHHQQQQQQGASECCEHGVASHLLNDDSQCSSSSHSRRSSMDFSAPLNTVSEGGVVGDAVGAVVPAGAVAAALNGTKAHSGAAGPKNGSSPFAGASGGEVSAPDSTSKQQQQKSVSFLPQLTAAVHASAASFSSRCSAGGSGGGAAALMLGPSRASSVTSQSSTSRCHSRCSRCSAVALNRSHSRQNFAALTGVAAAAAGEAGQAAASAAAVAADSSTRSSHHSGASTSAGGAAGGLDAADGTVRVTPLPAAAAAAGANSSGTAPAAAAGSSGAADAAGGPPGPGWVKVEGQYASIMCVVTSCISDKSRQGLMPEAHLADGRLALVMVEGCSRLQYLRFLVQLASKGIVPGSLPFVKVEYATEVQVEAEGRTSSWNVDGELLRHGRVNVGIHAGLVDVFARGVELM